MYFVWKPNIVNAELEKRPLWAEPWLECTRINSDDDEPFRLTVLPHHLHDDVLDAGTEFWALSRRLIELLETHQVNMEFFDFELSSEGQPISTSGFKIVHFLDCFTGVDIVKSGLGNVQRGTRPIIDGFVMTDECMTRQPALFRDTNRRMLMFMHVRLKAELEKNGVTNCHFTPYDEYGRGSLRRLVENLK